MVAVSVGDWLETVYHLTLLTLRRPMLQRGYSAKRQSARMSKITNDGITRTGTGCFLTVPGHWELLETKWTYTKQNVATVGVKGLMHLL